MEQERKENLDKAKKSLVWVGIASIVMMFAGLTSAMVVLQDDYFWVRTALPSMFVVSSAIILVSSLSMWWAVRAGKRNQQKNVLLGLAITMLLGLAFSYTQYLGWGKLVSEGRFFVGHVSDLKGTYGEDYLIIKRGKPLLSVDGNFYAPDDLSFSRPLNEKVDAAFNISSSFLYVISGLHLVHLAGGLIALLVTILAAYRGKYNQNNTTGLEVSAIYWHFLGALWIYLYLFFLFIR